MKKFLAIVALFLAPVALVVGVFAGAVYASGEWRTEEEIAGRVLAGEPAFLGLAYRDNTRYYKHLVASGKAAGLLVLGTSRSMQFHSEFFTSPSFYNAGGGANYVHEYRFFLENLPEASLPDTLVLVLDQYFFQEGWSAAETLPQLDYSHYPFNAGAALTRSLQDWAGGKYSLRAALAPAPNTYGMAAVGRGSGFYADGSYSYGRLLDHPEEGSDVAFHDSFDRIQRGVNRFEWAAEVYGPSLEEMDRLLAFCSGHGIRVAAVIPPYAPSVYLRMAESGNYGYLSLLPAALRECFAPYGFEVFDFTYKPDTLDAEYLDGYHGGDRVYARLTLELAAQSSLLAGQIDTGYLTAALAPSGNPLRLASAG